MPDDRDDTLKQARPSSGGRRSLGALRPWAESISNADTLVRVVPSSGASFAGAHPTELATGMVSSSSQPQPVEIGPRSSEAFDAATRYESRRVLGEGGMGEVKLCADKFIGRDVAIKIIKPGYGSSSDTQARFLREARVQGQLEHPSVVPVYDLGKDSAGEVYFTMKRISGSTLEEIIDQLRANDEETRAKFPLRRLLGALGQACLALAFAHSKGVVHRDLKPSNLMLGDFGEVYVLDWGVAKISTSPDAICEDEAGSSGSIAATQAGSLLGTPGYMSPEQAGGRAGECDARSDVYSMGVILYEVLTLEELHRGGSTLDVITSALRIDGAKPRSVLRDLPAELDSICERATRLDPSDRFESARELQEAIDEFLVGERDRERQLALADSHTSSAVALMKEATSDDDHHDRLRADAMRELGAALALDPLHARARAALVELLLDESHVPKEAQAELERIDHADRAKGATSASYAYMGWVLGIPLIVWMGIKSPLIISVVVSNVMLLAAYLWWMGRTNRARPRFMRIAVIWNIVAMTLMGVFFGPFMLVPQAIVSVSASMMVSLRANHRTRLFISIAGGVGLLLPMALCVMGVFPNPYSFENGNIVIHPLAVYFPPIPTLVFFFVASTFTTVLSPGMVGRAVEAMLQSEKRTAVRAVRLRQLLPTISESRDEPRARPSSMRECAASVISKA